MSSPRIPLQLAIWLHLTLIGTLLLGGLNACQSPKNRAATEQNNTSMSHTTPTHTTTFEEDVTFLKRYEKIIVLSDSTGQARILVSPGRQGRVMTSTAGGPQGSSYGWINRELIASGKTLPHINAVGGEDRFWLGPEGGQYALFFQKGDPFDLTHWQTPAPLDIEPFTVIAQRNDQITFEKITRLTNYAGTSLIMRIKRDIRLLPASEISTLLNCPLPDSLRVVGFESNNRLTNGGLQAWETSAGVPSIWILGMFTPSPATTIVIPFHEGSETQRGPIVNDAYFGKIPPERLAIQSGVLFFRGDGRQRGKLGLSFRRAKPLLGSYDALHGVLTLVQYSLPEAADGTIPPYVNSMWEIQREPYQGDVVNSYNDGPAQPGAKPMGPFYELETSSPAAVLKPGQHMTHIHRTIHLQGSREQLNAISRVTLGVTLEQIEQALP